MGCLMAAHFSINFSEERFSNDLIVEFLNRSTNLNRACMITVLKSLCASSFFDFFSKKNRLFITSALFGVFRYFIYF